MMYFFSGIANLQVIGKTLEKFVTFSFTDNPASRFKLVFKDSYNFLASPLDKLVC